MSKTQYQKHQTFSIVSWKPYLQMMQNNLKCFKNKKANAVNPISKPAKKIFARIFPAALLIDAK